MATLTDEAHRNMRLGLNPLEPKTPEQAPQQPASGQGLNFTGVEAIAVGTIAAGVFSAILNQRQQEKSRKDRQKEVAEEVRQKELDRAQSERASQRAAIGNVGEVAMKAGEQQQTALGRLASIFGGIS